MRWAHNLHVALDRVQGIETLHGTFFMGLAPLEFNSLGLAPWVVTTQVTMARQDMHVLTSSHTGQTPLGLGRSTERLGAFGAR